MSAARMVGAVYLPIWTVPAAAYALLVAYLLVDDYRKRRARRRARARRRRRYAG